MNKIVLVFLILCFSCRNEGSNDQMINESLITQNLIQEVFSNKSDPYIEDCTCISEESKIILPRRGSTRDFIVENLNIKDTIHLNQQIDHFIKFRMSQEILPQWNIISEDKFNLYKVSSNSNSLWDSLLIDCPKGYYTISKPIFNENYDRAIVGIGQACGRLCGGGVIRIYVLKNGQWSVEKEIYSWVS